jgi:hypothetical protein
MVHGMCREGVGSPWEKRVVRDELAFGTVREQELLQE